MPCPMFHKDFASGANDNIVGFHERKMEMSAKRVGFKSCWSYSVKNIRKETLGIFSLYHNYQNPPNDDEIQQLERYANLFQLIIEWTRMQNEHRISEVVFECQQGILVSDSNNCILKVNEAFCEITGYRPEDVKGHNPCMFRSDIQDQKFYKAMWASINRKGKWEGEIWNRRKSGELYPEHISIAAVKKQQWRHRKLRGHIDGYHPKQG